MEVMNMSKNNKKIIQEFFFKKKTDKVSDKLKKKFSYEPQDVKKDAGEMGFGSLLDLNKNPKTGESFISVTDPQEAGKRVVSALGASLGVNSVRNMASRSIKSFPIILSENVDPETSVMLKRVLEEQYAEYISLLISNQIVDISAFKTSEEEGNIAIQALDTVSSEDDEKALVRKASKGQIRPEDILKNLTAYNLIRNESKEYKTNNALLDSLLEGAFVVPSSESKDLIEFYQSYSEEIALLNELEDREGREAREKETKEEKRFVTLDRFLQNDLGLDGTKISNRKAAFDKLRGYEEVDENDEFNQWKIEKEEIDIEIASKDKEIAAMKLLADGKKIEKDIADLEQEIIDLEGKREKSLTSTKPDSGEFSTIEAKLAFKRRALERLEDAADEPEEAKKTLRVLERERDILDRELKLHNARRPKETKKVARWSRITSPDIVLDRKSLSDSINSTLGEILLNPKNEMIRDKFEKATFLLQANRIAGVEYIEYLVQRLAIPVSKEVRRRLVAEFKISDIIDTQNTPRRISQKDIQRIYQNQTLTKRVIEPMIATVGRTILVAALLGTGTAAATMAAQGTLATTAGSIGTWISGLGLGALATATWLPAVVGLGVGGIASIIGAVLSNRARSAQKNRKLQGWERVEALIEAMDEQQKDLRKVSVKSKEETAQDEVLESIALTSDQITSELQKYKGFMGDILKNTKPNTRELSQIRESEMPTLEGITEQDLLSFTEEYKILAESVNADKEYRATVLSEAIIQTTIPSTLELKYEYDTDKKPEVLVAPKFATRSQYAYGSTEYDKRELKDRRYNAPLLMKVNFKERFSDGTFSDNELTAVIGILGVITRVPSEEMEYILSSNADGNTIKGILEPDGDPSKLVSNILGIDKIQSDVKNLKQSGDVWQKLEKISRLSVSNKLAGRKTDNIANAHIVFAQKEVDNVRANEGHDYLKNIDLVSSLMKRYSAFTVMVANDVSERIYIYDNLGNASWDVVPYSALRNKDTGDQLNAMLNKMSSGRL
jgi:hypothetical protein